MPVPAPHHHHHHHNYYSQENPDLDGEKEKSDIEDVVKTLIAHFGQQPNSGLSTEVCSKLMQKRKDRARVTPHDCMEDTNVEDLSVTHRNAAAPKFDNVDKQVTVTTVVGGM